MTTKQMTPARGATPVLQRLEVFAGKWRTEGQRVASPAGPATGFSGTDAYEWMEGGHFMVHEVDVMMGDEKVIAIEIIGYDAASDAYFMHSYDNSGHADVMHTSVQDGIWTFQGKGVRCTVRFNENGNVMTGKWEWSDENGDWQHLMDVQLTRIT